MDYFKEDYNINVQKKENINQNFNFSLNYKKQKN